MEEPSIKKPVCCVKNAFGSPFFLSPKKDTELSINDCAYTIGVLLCETNVVKVEDIHGDMPGNGGDSAL